MSSGKRLSLFAKRNVYSDEKSGPIPPTAAAAPIDAPPPSYTANAAPQGPSLDEINAGFANLSIEDHPKTFPDTNLTLAHLKLLEAFFILKQDIGYTDGAFDLWDSRAPGTVESVANDEVARNTRNEALSKIREKRWALYVARAVHRFETWWTKVLCTYEDGQMLRQSDMATKQFQDWTSAGKVQRWTPTMLPPLGKPVMCLPNIMLY
jgi:hypothetical protein